MLNNKIKTMKKIISLIVFALLASCTKKDEPTIIQDTLPPITTNGTNTAGCIINGMVIIPKNTMNTVFGGPSTIYGLSTHIGSNFNPPDFNDFYTIEIINLKKREGINYSIYVQFNNLTNGIGDYIVGQSANDPFVNYPDNPQILVQEFNNGIYTGKKFLSSPNSGLIKLTRFDYSNNIKAGTFYCTLYNKDNPSETIKVTDGRFDINTSTLNY
jgi:hypothetical protein